MNKIGFWSNDDAGLPCFEYTGEIPYNAKLKSGDDVKLPEDPWFLLGNYHITLFTHVSGEYELITGQRSWGRINQGETQNSGVNSSEISIDGNNYFLTGINSVTKNSKRKFGCGYAKYCYTIGKTFVERYLAVKPSASPYDGTSAFLLTVAVKNNDRSRKNYSYNEKMGVLYKEIQPENNVKINYIYEPISENNIAFVKINSATDEPMKPKREEMSRHEYFPPSPFICDVSGTGAVSAAENEIKFRSEFSLEPGEEKVFQIAIGFSMIEKMSDIISIVNKINCGKIIFSEEWEKILPEFKNEPDTDLKRELIWHAYCLEAMATYSEYYGETKIPQGTIYDYYWGQHASARDNFQHALPCAYYNPSLAKSVLRYMLKRTTPFGEIRLIELGNGFAYHDRYFTSDQQLYFFILLTEYLEVTKDYAFLTETVNPYPAKNMREMTVLELSRQCFIFLRDTVGTGAHGLINLLNSDWNDGVYYLENVPYNSIFYSGESHMNTAMALSVFDKFAQELNNAAEIISADISEFSESVIFYRSRLLTAFMADMEGNDFPKRMYFNGKVYGKNNMFLEPQGFTLQIKELSPKIKNKIYSEMQKRLYFGEKIGARQQEIPEFDGGIEWDKGSRENGGFWWALNGPVIIGVATFNKTEAKKLLRNMTLKNLSEQFPEYWSSWWSAADTLESSLVPSEGLTDQSCDFWREPVFCAHPHAWILYCYYKINE